MMKKQFKRMAATALSAAVLSVSALAAPADIAGHWAEPVIAKWMEAEKISGYEDGSFRPDNRVTRGEFAQMLFNVLKDREPVETSTHRFSDVAETDWFYPAVMHLLNLQVVAEGEVFSPESYITRQDAMTMIGRGFWIRAYGSEAIADFADYAEVSEYAAEIVAGLVEGQYVSGYEDNTLRPLGEITRAESLKILDGVNPVHEKNSPEGILERLYAGVPKMQIALMNIEIYEENVSYFLGLETMDGIERAVASEPMMSAIAHSVCLVKAKEGTDIEAMKEAIRTKVDPRKWVCVGVEREEVIVLNKGNWILLIIDQNNPKAFQESFEKLEIQEKKTLLSKDENGLYCADGIYLDSIGSLKHQSVLRFAQKVEELSAKYLQNSNRIYYAVAPGKTYYVNDRLPEPFDYDGMLDILQKNITSAQYINLFDTLTLLDYYATDPHWRQEKLQNTVNRLGEHLGFSVDFSGFRVNEMTNFKGQHGYQKENFPTETLYYLTDSAIDGATVSNTQTPEVTTVYDLAKYQSASPYDMFLSGPTPLLTIENPQSQSEKELILFRDSSASSLTPLLIGQYGKITLIDIRYMMSAMLGSYVDFDGKDVLFLYGEQIINNSEMLR